MLNHISIGFGRWRFSNRPQWLSQFDCKSSKLSSRQYSKRNYLSDTTHCNASDFSHLNYGFVHLYSHFLKQFEFFVSTSVFGYRNILQNLCRVSQQEFEYSERAWARDIPEAWRYLFRASCLQYFRGQKPVSHLVSFWFPNYSEFCGLRIASKELGSEPLSKLKECWNNLIASSFRVIYDPDSLGFILRCLSFST